MIHSTTGYKWSTFLLNEDDKGYQILSLFDELFLSKQSLTDQVLSFVRIVKNIEGLDNLNNSDASARLYDVFKVIFEFEKHGLAEHIQHNYLYIVIDDLDKNWSSKEENFVLIRSLFECIIELYRRYYKNLKFVVALRTDIFGQIEFHQTEKIRSYVIEITWGYDQLRNLVEKRLSRYWNLNQVYVWNAFPKKILDREGVEIEVFDYFFRRTMWRPRDFIIFINLCIGEAQSRQSNTISTTDIYRAESVYSRQRMEALRDEWKFVYPELQKWIDMFAGGKSRYDYSELQRLFKDNRHTAKAIIDALYRVGFLGFKPSPTYRVCYSFSSKYAAPSVKHNFFVNRGFVTYLKERAEELGMQIIDEKANDEDIPEVYSRTKSDSQHIPSIVNDSTGGSSSDDSRNALKHTRVLAVFANPSGSDPLRLGEEARVLNECIALSKQRDNITLRVLHATRVSDLRRALLNDEYDVVHFSGHSTGKGLAFEDERGKVKIIPQGALGELLSAYSPPVQCVILNACYTNSQSALISMGVPFTIGVDGAISDDGAIEFTRGFYDAMGAGKDFEFAFQEGCRSMKLMGYDNEVIPMLLKKDE